MKQIDFETYLDKVYGCWLGKCIVGTIGAPYEGMKQLLKLEYSEKFIEKMLPNDDLDLQVLWLKVLEEEGVGVTSESLAAAFHRYNVYWPGEYAWFNKNYERGIRPPYSALYENDYYFEGMGCPIRAEIWGLVLPLNPELAAGAAGMDGVLDHHGNSVFFEQFWAAMVSAAFAESDIEKLVEIGLRQIPGESRAAALIRDTLAWCAESDDYVYVRSRLIAEYGHSDCTYSMLNIGLTLVCILLGKGDYIKSAMIACNCGYDTDCTAGNAGALLGLIYGAKYLEREWGFRESGYVLTLDYHRPTDRVVDLARDTARVGVHFLMNYPGAENCLCEIPAGIPPIGAKRPAEIEILNHYDLPPYLAPGERYVMRVVLANHGTRSRELSLSVEAPENFSASVCPAALVPAWGTAEVLVQIACAAGTKLLRERNLFTLRADEFSRVFGIVGKTAYTFYGPFWELNYTVDLGDNSKSYMAFIPGATEEQFADNLRDYHINCHVDTEKEYLRLADLTQGNVPGGSFEREGRTFYASGDNFTIGEFSRFQGPATYYLVRRIVLERAQTFKLQIGHSDAFKLWLNGELLAERSNVENWTPENVHREKIQLTAGENVLVFRVCRRTQDAKFSLNFLLDKPCPPHAVTLNSKIQ